MGRASSRRKLYSSSGARVPTHWGRTTWDALFSLVLHGAEVGDTTLDARRRRAWSTALTVLPDILTCGVCSYHFAEYLRADGGKPFVDALRNRDTLFAWLYEAKRQVNERNGRTSLTLARARTRYGSNRKTKRHASTARLWEALFRLASDFPHEKHCVDDDEYDAEMIARRTNAWRTLFLVMPDLLASEEYSRHLAGFIREKRGAPFARAFDDRERLFEWLHEAKRRWHGTDKLTLAQTRARYIPKC